METYLRHTQSSEAFPSWALAFARMIPHKLGRIAYDSSLGALSVELRPRSVLSLRQALRLSPLSKDYAIKGHPTDAEKIKGMPLAQCIKDFVKDARVQEVAKRAAWLGNDETHYIRKWENKDLNDLKSLIHLTVNWIDMELTTEELLRSMPAPK